jgi:hypothetical protein
MAVHFLRVGVRAFPGHHQMCPAAGPTNTGYGPDLTPESPVVDPQGPLIGG